MSYRILFLLLSIFVLGSPASGQSLGGETLSKYKQDLQHALRSGMSQGLEEAMDACSIQAPKIAESLSQDKILVGRTSHLLRNPNNVPPVWVEPILDAYISNMDDREPRTVSLSDGRSGYVEPIILQPMCTTCHGESVAKELSIQITKLYPHDKAVGFSVGDLRGVFWVEYPENKSHK